ncbi:2,3-bisphosphoglycerate-dependent phosphoglycerate mutase, partial [Pantoea septica]
QWRRGFAVTPPELDRNDERFPGHDPRYAKLSAEQLPTTESLALTIDRVIPYWNESILPRIKSGEKVIIAAHGNSLRALVKYLDNMSEDEILELNIPTGVPLVYEFDENFKPIKHYYLGDADEIAAKAAAVANQGKAK